MIERIRRVCAIVFAGSLFSNSIASAQTSWPPAEHFQTPPPSPTQSDPSWEDVVEGGLFLALLAGFSYDQIMNGTPSSSGGSNNFQRPNSSGDSSSEAPPEQENTGGLYGNCHNLMGC